VSKPINEQKGLYCRKEVGRGKGEDKTEEATAIRTEKSPKPYKRGKILCGGGMDKRYKKVASMVQIGYLPASFFTPFTISLGCGRART